MTTEQQYDNQKDSIAVGPGKLLRNAREQLGWTREQVASRLHLRLTLINEIESDTYDKYTSHTFIRGYLRAYAKLVGIPEETILAAYDRLGLTPPDNIDMESFSRRSRQQASDSRLKLVTWLVILVLIGLSVAWWWQSTARRSASDEALAATEMGAMQPEQTSARTSTADPQTQGDMPTPPTGAEQPVASEPVSSGVPATGNRGATQASAAVATSDATNVTAANATQDVSENNPTNIPQLKMSFTADCWLDVKDADGKILYSGMKKANDELVLEGAEPLRLIIGAPMAVKIEYKGNAFDMSRYNNGRTARISLPQE